MGKKKKKNKHKKKKWQSLLRVLEGKPHTPYYQKHLVDTYYCQKCDYILVNKDSEEWHRCPNCKAKEKFKFVAKKDITDFTFRN